MTQGDVLDELRAAADGLSGVAVKFVVDEQEAVVGGGEPQATLTLSAQSLRRMLLREVESSVLFMQGELVIEGDMAAAVAFGKALEELHEGSSEPVEKAGDSNANIRYLDNIGLIVLDLDACANVYSNMGFNLASRGTHYYEDANNDFHRWGTANYCVNFRDGGLLEFIGHYYKDYPAGLYGEQLKALGNHWGKITIHNSSTEDEVARLRRQGYAVASPSILYRYTDGDEFDPDPTKSKRTSLISYPTSMSDSFMTTGAQHELGQWPISEAHFLHRNGARSMPYALVGATDMSETIARYEEALSIKSEAYLLGRRINLGRETFIYFVEHGLLPEPLRNQMGSRPVAALGAGIRVSDIGDTRRFLSSTDFTVEDGPFGISVYGPVENSGAIFFSE